MTIDRLILECGGDRERAEFIRNRYGVNSLRELQDKTGGKDFLPEDFQRMDKTDDELFWDARIILDPLVKQDENLEFPDIHVPFEGYGSKKKTAIKQSRPIIDTILTEISSSLLAHQKEYGRLRIFWQDHIDERVRRELIEQGVPIPEDFEAIQFGIKGGETKQGGVCAEIFFPVPKDQVVMDAFLSLGLRHKIVDGVVRCNSTKYALGLVKLGCPITDYKSSYNAVGAPR